MAVQIRSPISNYYVYGGNLLRKSRIVYSSVVRPAMAYAAPIWHTPAQKAKGIAAKLGQLSQSAYGSLPRPTKLLRSGILRLRPLRSRLIYTLREG